MSNIAEVIVRAVTINSLVSAHILQFQFKILRRIRLQNNCIIQNNYRDYNEFMISNNN